MKPGQPMSRGCCGTRTFPDEAKAIRVLGKITALRGAEGGDATYSAATRAYECRAGNWHLGEPAADTGPDARTRAAVYARDGFKCVCCGTSIIGLPHSVGHRMRRSQGAGNCFTDLLTFLGWGNGLLGDDVDHHHRIDSRVDPHDEAAGYTVRSYDNPARVPVLYVSAYGSGQMAWLTPDGGLAFECPFEPERAA